MESLKKSDVPFLMVLIKLGAKILPKMMKVLKGLFGLKALGAATSVGLYSYLFTWQMGIAFVAFVAWHEYGHLYAMQKCGIKTSGIYLIPGFGGVALAAEGFKSGRNEVYIALNGPLFGLLLAVATLAIFSATGDPLFLSIASVMTFVNLFNLFPINPLDGGRVIKALLYSLRESLGFIFMMISLLFAAAIGLHFGMGLIVFVTLIGCYEVLGDYGLSESLNMLTSTFWRIFISSVFVIQVIPVAFMNTSWVVWFVVVFVTLFVLTLTVVDAIHTAYRRGGRGLRSIFFYPWYVLYEAYLGIRQLFSLNVSSLKRIDGHVPMSKKEVWRYGFYYIVLVAVHMTLLLAISLLPGMAEVGHLLS